MVTLGQTKYLEDSPVNTSVLSRSQQEKPTDGCERLPCLKPELNITRFGVVFKASEVQKKVLKKVIVIQVSSYAQQTFIVSLKMAGLKEKFKQKNAHN